MSARKWPMYTMAVGESFVHPRRDTRFCKTVSRYALSVGKVFVTRRIDEGRLVRRVA